MKKLWIHEDKSERLGSCLWKRRAVQTGLCICVRKPNVCKQKDLKKCSEPLSEDFKESERNMMLYTAVALFTALCTVPRVIWSAAVEEQTPGESLPSPAPPQLQERAMSSFNSSYKGSGYMCYFCSPLDKQPCTNTLDCSTLGVFDRCFISEVLGVVTQGCMKAELCSSVLSCCEGHLCNSAPLALAPPSVLLMGLSAAFITRFL